MFIDNYTFNRVKLEAEIQKLLNETFYRCSELDYKTISAVINAVLYASEIHTFTIKPHDVKTIVEEYNYQDFFTEYTAKVDYSRTDIGVIDEITISQIGVSMSNNKRKVKSRSSIKLFAKKILIPKDSIKV